MKITKIFKVIILPLILILTLTGCMNNTNNGEDTKTIAKSGDKVVVHYTLYSEDGEKLESSYDAGSPLEFTLGGGQMIPGFDAAVVDMNIGDKKTITLAPADAYGERNDDAVQIIPKEELAEFVDMGISLEPGESLPTVYGPLEILDADDDTITVDMNHPMAGKTLIFDIELVEIK